MRRCLYLKKMWSFAKLDVERIGSSSLSGERKNGPTRHGGSRFCLPATRQKPPRPAIQLG
ncbi:hypothetical protein B4113_3987 [Geobacillus sp. B4113_201601]|nr:hypothetical protein B4113_3987 [Geobacillus sp. B4113_201601]